MGIIAKRPIANTAWGAETSPSSYADEYFRRAEIMLEEGPVPGAPDDSVLLALGFTLANQSIDTAIVGTSDPDHMQENIRMVEQELPIAEEAVQALKDRFYEFDSEWLQEG
jgi:aryl-alcohol dehydrogenase-like predicted oxidoreductase